VWSKAWQGRLLLSFVFEFVALQKGEPVAIEHEADVDEVFAVVGAL
jgi:hypothetical protein